MAKRRTKSKKRGGASADPACKRQLASCMKETVCKRGMKSAGRVCMNEFNSCRVGAKVQPARRRRRKSR